MLRKIIMELQFSINITIQMNKMNLISNKLMNKNLNILYRLIKMNKKN